MWSLFWSTEEFQQCRFSNEKCKCSLIRLWQNWSSAFSYNRCTYGWSITWINTLQTESAMAVVVDIVPIGDGTILPIAWEFSNLPSAIRSITTPFIPIICLVLIHNNYLHKPRCKQTWLTLCSFSFLREFFWSITSWKMKLLGHKEVGFATNSCQSSSQI